MTDDSLRTEFAKAYDDYADAIFRHCYCRVYERELAIDLMQEAFMKTWEYLISGKKIDNTRAFLYRTANNLVIDHVRRSKKRQQDSLENLQMDGFDVADENVKKFGDLLDEKYIVTTLQKVEEPYRTALIMRYIDELSPKEIAAALNEKVNTVSVRINRGLEKLRTLIPAHG